MSNKIRLLSIVLGASALAGLTYGVARRGLQRRAAQPLASHIAASSELQGATSAESVELSDWETLEVHSSRLSSPDALDVALNLNGLFDAQSDEELAVTVRPSDRVPAPFGGDDEEAPNADDLGLAWLAQATQAEHSLRGADLTPDVENIALIGDEAGDEAEEADVVDAELTESDLADHDEHEDFRRTRA